jgi:hypothetical protein
MIQNRLYAGETMNPHNFFVIERSVRLPELGVPLVGDLAQLEVIGHVKPPVG